MKLQDKSSSENMTSDYLEATELISITVECFANHTKG